MNMQALKLARTAFVFGEKKRHPSWDQRNDTFKEAILSHHQLREEMVNTQCHQETLSNSTSDEIHSNIRRSLFLTEEGTKNNTPVMDQKVSLPTESRSGS